MLNKDSRIQEEKQHLLPYKPPLELAAISENTVNTSSMVSIDTVFYSVPEHLVGKKVIVKKYHDEIRIYAANRYPKIRAALAPFFAKRKIMRTDLQT